VYVVVLVGKTCRWPWLWTAPIPELIDMSVALLMDQLKVDDCPRSMVDGSAVKLLMVGLSTLATVSGAAAAGGGGGGGGGTFFLHPEANAISTSANNTALILPYRRAERDAGPECFWSNRGPPPQPVRLKACNLSLSLIGNILLFCFKQSSGAGWDPRPVRCY
jgi:hypothetical protein